MVKWPGILIQDLLKIANKIAAHDKEKNTTHACDLNHNCI